MQFFCSLLLIMFFYGVRPMDTNFLNLMELFNETCFLVASYFMFLFTSYVEDPAIRYSIGWLLIGVVVINIFANWMAIFYKTGPHVYTKLKILI